MPSVLHLNDFEISNNVYKRLRGPLNKRQILKNKTVKLKSQRVQLEAKSQPKTNLVKQTDSQALIHVVI